MTDTNDTPLDGTEKWDQYEEKLDELNEGLLDAYAAGYAKAVEDFDIDEVPVTNADELREWRYIAECSYYFWDGRTKPLELWLREQFGIGVASTQDGDRHESERY